MEMSGQFHDPAALTLGERDSGTHCREDCVGTRAYLDAVIKRNICSLLKKSIPDSSVVPTVIPTLLSRLK
jgi:hypothetical protein